MIEGKRQREREGDKWEGDLGGGGADRWRETERGRERDRETETRRERRAGMERKSGREITRIRKHLFYKVL